MHAMSLLTVCSLAHRSGQKRRRPVHGDGDRYRDSHSGGKRYRQDNGGRSRGKEREELLPFGRWRSMHGKDLESEREAEEKYKEYVTQWTRKQEDIFMRQHENEDWFQDRYAFNRLIKIREQRQRDFKQEARRLLDLCAEDNQEALAQLLPDLDCPPDLYKYLQENRVQRGGRKFFSESGLKPVGDLFAKERTVYIPRIPPRISNDTVRESLEKAIQGREELKDLTADDLKFEVIYNDACSTCHKGTEPFDRCAWVECASELVCKVLIQLSSLKIGDASSEGERRDNDEAVEIRLNPKLDFPNKLVPADASAFSRIEHDVKQAFELAHVLDMQEGLSDEKLGIEQLLDESAIDRLLEKATAAKVEQRKILAGENQTEDQGQILSVHFDLARKLDIILGYLRRVHLTCYYSFTSYRDKGDLAYSSMVPRLRVPLETKVILEQHKLAEQQGAPEKEGAKDEGDGKNRETTAKPASRKSRYLQRLDDEIAAIMKRNNEDAKKERALQREKDTERAEKLKTEAVESFCEAETKQEGENRFRCMLPPYKLFRAKSFVFKHIHAKHTDRIAEVEAEAMKVLTREIFRRDQMKPLPTVEQNLDLGYGRNQEAPPMPPRFGPRGPPPLLAGFGPRPPPPMLQGFGPRPHFPRGNPMFNQQPPQRMYNDPDATQEKVVDLKYSRPVVDYSDL